MTSMLRLIKRRYYEFRPPMMVLDAEMRCVLSAAFAEVHPDEQVPKSPERALELVHLFDLTGQITSRMTRNQLSKAFGVAGGAILAEASRRRVMRGLAVVQARQIVCEAADAAGIEIVLLKQAALEVMGIVTSAQRFASDVDVLVEANGIPALSEALGNRGCTLRPRRNPTYHPAVFRTLADISVELHTAIPYLRMERGGSFADLRELTRSGQVSTDGVNRFSHVRVPRLSVLAAHLLAHSLVQHRFTPRHHSAFRGILDAWYMALDQDRELADAAYGFIETDVARDEYEGLIELVGALRSGRVYGLSANALTLLRHAIASAADDRYRGQVLLQREIQIIREIGVLHWVAARVERLFNPTAEELSWLVRDGAATDPRAARGMMPIVFAGRVWRAVRATVAKPGGISLR